MRVSMVDALKAVGYAVQEASTGVEGLGAVAGFTVQSGDYRFAIARCGRASYREAVQGAVPWHGSDCHYCSWFC